MQRWESVPASGTSTYLLDSIERNKSNKQKNKEKVENNEVNLKAHSSNDTLYL